jgi:hypothetical protein
VEVTPCDWAVRAARTVMVVCAAWTGILRVEKIEFRTGTAN